MAPPEVNLAGQSSCVGTTVNGPGNALLCRFPQKINMCWKDLTFTHEELTRPADSSFSVMHHVQHGV